MCLINDFNRNLLTAELTEYFLENYEAFEDRNYLEIARDLLAFVNLEIKRINTEQDLKLKPLLDLTTHMIVKIIAKKHHIALVDMLVLAGCDDYKADPSADTSGEQYLFAIYNEETGLYHSDSIFLHRIINQLRPNSVESERKEIYLALKMLAPIKPRNLNPNFTPVNNGIFDYKTKELLPFSPEHVFFSKSRINYNKDAKNPIIYNSEDDTYWDVDSWVNELSDNPDIVKLLWQIIGANVRSEHPWGQSVWFYSPVGSNGKGTFCQLLRNITANHVSISIPQFKVDAYLTRLVRATNIVVDENPVGAYLDDSANLKAISTLDLLTVNPKYKEAISLRFRGFMVQCVNDMPRVQDRSPSFLRRQIIVPWKKQFLGKTDRKYIKTKYVARVDVLEYVLKKVLESDYYTLDIPEECAELLTQYRHYNDPLAQFYDEVVNEECVWDFIPYSFLYDLYKKWYNKVNPEGKALSINRFKEELNFLAINDFDLYPKNAYHVHRYPDLKFNTTHEPLILEYDLTDWQDPHYKGPNPEAKANFTRKKSYRGLMRKEKES